MAESSEKNAKIKTSMLSDSEKVEKLLNYTIEYKKNGGKKKIAKKKEQTPAQKLMHTISNVIAFACIAVLCFFIYNGFQAKKNGEIPSVLGYSVFNVETGSMVPTLPIGSVIVVHKASDAENIPIGTITTFYFTSGTVVTHRIIDAFYEDGVKKYQTKGDNPINDPDPEYLTPDRVIGTFVFKITLPSIWGDNNAETT